MDALASVAELEKHLQRKFDDPDPAEQALQLASGAVRTHCGWNLTREDITFHAEGDGGANLNLPTGHLAEITEIRINGVVLDPQLYYWSRKGQVWHAPGWPRYRSIEVDATHGFETAPDVITLVTLDIAAKQLLNPTGLASVTVGPVSRTWATAGQNTGMLTKLHEALLERYSI